ncbi:citrate lyase acyl carrier protein [Vibrio tapetis]|uniref:Citrate lyase acyl carrier protein n=1 Tax=Vibrio tapetis subsp. tapetis TaxID=1671868 RepID=A0A2N8ZIP6_9VIBR|nr:citrate lyase acyl carrier protein [Vibrio tapetis]SON51784.1 citrate lyase, acyl carrier (gamma) subunit [Vibrio tapetis subsp. tapetis]
MHINQRSYAGTLESSDLLVEVSPCFSNQVEIDINSSVEKQFASAIRQVVTSTLDEMGVKSALVVVNDKGALDCVIRARVQAAIMRAASIGDQDIVWGTV